MTYPHANPFDQAPAESEGKMAFGTLRVFTNKVNLVKGAEYIMDSLGIDPEPDSPLNRLTDKSGNLWTFRGKQNTSNGSHTHVIPVITRKASDGRLYNDFRDFMYWDKDVCQRVTIPSLQKHFGAKLAGIWGKSAEVQAEVIEVEDGAYKRQAFRIVTVFKTREERETAETAFFGQFQQTADQIADEMMGEDPIPWDADGKPIESAPVGMSKEAATALLPTLYAASGQDKDKFLAQLSGMPVVIEALGVGKDELGKSPEIIAIYADSLIRKVWDEFQQDDKIEPQDRKGEFLNWLKADTVLLQVLGGIDSPVVKAVTG